VADVLVAPGAAAVMLGAWPSVVQARIITGLSGDDRWAAVPHDDEAGLGECL
jgi:hypothetical protein